MQQHGSKYSPRSFGGVKIHDHVANQIQWNHKCSNLPPPRPRGGVNIELFQNIVMWHIKLNGITNATTW